MALRNAMDDAGNKIYFNKITSPAELGELVGKVKEAFNNFVKDVGESRKIKPEEWATREDISQKKKGFTAMFGNAEDRPVVVCLKYKKDDEQFFSDIQAKMSPSRKLDE